MTAVPGYDLLKSTHIPELNTDALLYQHTKTGALILSLVNDDENKAFGVNFRTIPTDSTGVPHILEHSVLCGSRNYPVKEPFIELAKSSLNTFLNAFTYPDRTCYPVASQNLQDLHNLMDVYLDAVFYPLLTRATYEQEGWHYVLDAPDAPLAYKGVVFNEMKGAYSSPEALMGKYSMEAMFPDSDYRVDSGGDPTVIPDLTYEQLVEFHRRHYHPSNALFYFYGDDDPTNRLERLLPWLDKFERVEPVAVPSLQPSFAAPIKVERTYPQDPDSEDVKPMLTVNWLLPEVTDLDLTVSLEVLSTILLGSPAAPLRKALIESGLGENVMGGGIDTDLRQAVFSIGMKGVAPANLEPLESLILQTLSDLAEHGIDPKQIEASLNSVEFSLRENNTGRFPRGLAHMLTALTAWVYNADPIEPLFFERHLTSVKTNLANNPRYFEDLIGQYLLNNPHRVTMTLRPDPTLSEKIAAEEQARLDAVAATLTDEARRQIVENTAMLQAMQETPDAPEALATIPTLTLADIERENKRIPSEAGAVADTPVLYHDLFTNGVMYVDLAFDLRLLPQDDLPYLPLFGRALTEMGTHTEDYVSLVQRIERETGGVVASASALGHFHEDRPNAFLMLRGKAMLPKIDELFNILRDILLSVRLDNRDRFKQMVLQSKARLESGLVPSGHAVVASRLRAQLSASGLVSEQFSGISYLYFIRKLAEQVENDWPSVLARLESIRQRLVNRQAVRANLTLPASNWPTVNTALESFLTALPASAPQWQDWQLTLPRTHEAFTIPAQVNYVGKGANLYELGYTFHGSALAINNYLNTTYLWERVRVQGGAYGGFSTFNRLSGVFAYLSYRDPNLIDTLENYDGTPDFLQALDLSPSELERAILGAIGDLDAYLLPDAKGYTAFVRTLVGDSDDRRQQMRDELLGTTVSDFRRFGETLAELNHRGQVVVLGSSASVSTAQKAQADLFSSVQRLL